MSQSDRPAIARRIVGFHRDDEQHWVADLECGHGQHVRHDPPWQNREWVTTAAGRAERLGTILRCVRCLNDIPAMHQRAVELVETLALLPHPEGGFYRETFRSTIRVRPDDARRDRSALTTILYLMPRGTFSRWHQVDSDEVWHFLEGDGLDLAEMRAEGGDVQIHRLARSVEGLPGYARTIPAGNWQAARPVGDYALVGCTVGPGFEFDDFRMLSADEDFAATIRTRYPEAADFI